MKSSHIEVLPQQRLGDRRAFAFGKGTLCSASLFCVDKGANGRQMPTKDYNITGTHLHDSPIDGHHVNGDRAKGDHITFDARVHWVDAAKSNAAITILLRYNGQFTRSIVEPKLVDAVTLKTAQHLTTESLVRISGAKVPENENLEDKSVPVAVTFRVSKIVTLSEARADLPKGIVSHGAPGEEPRPLELSAELLQERLNNRLLDARVAANGAAFKLFSGVHELAVEHMAAVDFYQVPTPGLINYEFPGDEHEQFPLPYFDNKQAWLAQTGEYHLAMSLAADLERVYDIHTVFRREEKVTPRHLTEVTPPFPPFEFTSREDTIYDCSKPYYLNTDFESSLLYLR